jgi:hypothetical protein
MGERLIPPLMNRPSRFRNLFAGLLALMLLPLASEGATTAVPIVFIFDGTGTGSIGGTSFTNSNFAIVVTANTQNAFTEGITRLILASAVTVEIDGFTAATFSVPLRLFSNSIYSRPPGATGDESLGLSLASGADLLTLFESGFAGYDFTSQLGPVFDPVPQYQSRLAFTNIGTDLGGLTFTSTRDITFTATIVPEIGSMALVAIGSAAGLAVGSRKRRAASQTR